MGRYRTALASDLREGDWRERAACAGLADADLDPWHPHDDLPPVDQRAAYDLAAEVCADCPVRRDCREFGVAMLPLLGPDAVGMYGGLTPDDLVNLARAQRKPARKIAEHGTRARRVTGCRCDDCKRAHAEYVAGLRAAERHTQPPPATCGAPRRNGGPCTQRVHTDGDTCHMHARPAVA